MYRLVYMFYVQTALIYKNDVILVKYHLAHDVLNQMAYTKCIV